MLSVTLTGTILTFTNGERLQKVKAVDQSCTAVKGQDWSGDQNPGSMEQASGSSIAPWVVCIPQ